MKKITIILLAILLPNILLAACGASKTATPTPVPLVVTITMENGQCTYDGPQPIPAGAKIPATWIVKDPEQKAYSVVALVLRPGKTLEDAKSVILSGSDPTAWVETAGAAEALGGGSKPFDLRTTKGPIYFHCFLTLGTSTFIGPFEVEGTGPNEVTLPEIVIDAADYSYSAPQTVTAGWTRVTLTNSGTEPHHVQFLRLNDGVTVQQFEDALKQAEGPALAMTKLVGGVGAIHPSGTASAVINLPAGEYVILCLVPSPSDHVAHHVKGMIKSLTVEAGQGSASEPSADVTVQLKDFSFDMPDSLPTGPLTIKVVNNGPEAHEFNIMKLADGKTFDDVIQFLNGTAGGPPPFTPVGGMNGLDMGQWGYAEVNLEPGAYVAICNIPSPKAEGHPHFMFGMIKQFTVKP